jgi:hypothetical protein
MYPYDILFAAAASAPASSSGSTQILIAALGAGGISAIVAAIVTGLFSKRKLGAEATEIITKAASGVVTSIEAELRRSQDGRVADRLEFERTMTDLRAAHASEIEEVRQVLQLHVAWDVMAIAKIEELTAASGLESKLGDLPKAPPLLPPHIGKLER